MVTTTRKTVPVDAEEQALAERLRDPESLERRALARLGLVDLDAVTSEAQALHALLAVGHRVLREQVLELGYAELARTEDDEDRAVRRALRRRAAELED